MIDTLLARGQSFLMLNKRSFVAQADLWRQCLPAVKPFYAVKCNDNPSILNWVREANFGYDCASPKEIFTALRLGVPVSDILYANPAKGPKELLAVQQAAPTVTIDNIFEARKLRELDYKGKVILRIAVDDSQSLVKFSNKFGAHGTDIEELYRSKMFRFAGISFHVGSMAKALSAFDHAIVRAEQVWQTYEAMFVKEPVLDIGGGFAGDDNDFFKQQTRYIQYTARKFPTVIAEPGRYLATRCGTAYVPIIARRRINGMQCYTLDESVYGLFNNTVFDHYDVAKNISIVDCAGSILASEPCMLFGRTCDGMDVIAKNVLLPKGLTTGTYLQFYNMGAYTNVAQSPFNGFKTSQVYVEE